MYKLFLTFRYLTRKKIVCDNAAKLYRFVN